MRNLIILVLLAGLGGAGFLLVKKVGDVSARNRFIDRAQQLSYEVQRTAPADRKLNADDVADVMRGLVDEFPEVTLQGELKTETVPFACGGKDEPDELQHLSSLDRGNARNLAIRCKGVEIVGVRGRMKAGREVFDVEAWTYVRDP